MSHPSGIKQTKRGERKRTGERKGGDARREAQDAKKRHKTAHGSDRARPFNIPARASTRSAGPDASCLGYPAETRRSESFVTASRWVSPTSESPSSGVRSRNFAARDLQPDRLPDRCDDTSDFVNLYGSWITRRNNGVVGWWRSRLGLKRTKRERERGKRGGTLLPLLCIIVLLDISFLAGRIVECKNSLESGRE